MPDAGHGDLEPPGPRRFRVPRPSDVPPTRLPVLTSRLRHTVATCPVSVQGWLAPGLQERLGELAVSAPLALAVVAVVYIGVALRSEEHTSELQSLRHLVCRLLLEKKN